MGLFQDVAADSSNFGILGVFQVSYANKGIYHTRQAMLRLILGAR